MKIYKGHTYRLKPTAEQEQLFSQHAGVCRLVYNLALEQRRDWWRHYQKATGDNLNYVTQARQLTDLRREFGFIREVSQTAEQRALKALDTAFKNFFAGRGGFPKPRKKGVDDSFAFLGREITIERLNAKWSRVKLPKMGWVRFRDTRPVAGKVTEATVTKTALGWQISIGAYVEKDVATSGLPTVGIDRGVAVPLQLSDGSCYTLPESIDWLNKLHKRAQRIAARRKKGSSRHRKAIQRAAKIKARQARIRKDWAHRTTTDIARLNGVVVVERLRTKDMTASVKGTAEQPGRNVAQKRGLNRVILNVGWFQIETMLAYKLAYRGGSLIKVNPAHTSQTCAACGNVDSRSRKNQASFVCTACGHRSNADLNAAINILNRGNTAVLDVKDGHKLSVEASTPKAA
jgi:putative transposase